MLWLRMFLAFLRLWWPYLLTPWRSPLLRWRMETYGVLNAQGRLLHADQMTAADLLRFVTGRRSELSRFLRWSAQL